MDVTDFMYLERNSMYMKIYETIYLLISFPVFIFIHCVPLFSNKFKKESLGAHSYTTSFNRQANACLRLQRPLIIPTSPPTL